MTGYLNPNIHSRRTTSFRGVRVLELNADRKRDLVAALEHVDELLSERRRVLEIARSPSSLPEYVCYITPGRQKRMLEYIANFRVEAGGLLKQHGTMPSRAHKAAAGAVLWAAVGSLLS